MLHNVSALTRLATDASYECRLSGALHLLIEADGRWQPAVASIKANILFLFHKYPTTDESPFAMYIIDDCLVEICDDNATGRMFTFSLRFRTSGRCCTFAADSLRSLEKWVSVLTVSSWEYVRATTQFYDDDQQLPVVDSSHDDDLKL
jgi:hypothetical protein